MTRGERIHEAIWLSLLAGILLASAVLAIAAQVPQ